MKDINKINIFYLWMERINMGTMSVLPYSIYRVNVITVKIPGNYFVDID
jgi:hypothetical protein